MPVQSSSAPGFSALDVPKSQILGLKSESKSMLPGFKSPWIMRGSHCWCRYLAPWAIPLIIWWRLGHSSASLDLSPVINHALHENCMFWSQASVYKASRNMPYMKESKLLFGIYSNTKILSLLWIQYPRSLTIFVCWSFGISSTSFLKCSNGIFPSYDALLTATSTPDFSWPWKV